MLAIFEGCVNEHKIISKVGEEEICVYVWSARVFIIQKWTETDQGEMIFESNRRSEGEKEMEN